MALSVAGSGEQTCVIGTEHTVFTTNVPGTYLCYINVANMAAGDTVELRMKFAIRTSSVGSARDAAAPLGSYSGAQAEDVKSIGPFACPFGFDLTIKQTAGTGRVIGWSVCQVG